MAIRRTDSFDMNAAESRRVQAQTAINQRTQKENDRLYQEATKLSQSGGPRRLDQVKSQIGNMERSIKMLSQAAAREAEEAAKVAKMNPRQRAQYEMQQKMIGGMRGTYGGLSMLDQIRGNQQARSSMNDVIGQAMQRAQYGGYEPTTKGYQKALGDLEALKRERDTLTKQLDPQYLTPGVAPAADPEAAGRGRRRSAAASTAARGGRQATILSQGG